MADPAGAQLARAPPLQAPSPVSRPIAVCSAARRLCCGATSAASVDAGQHQAYQIPLRRGLLIGMRERRADHLAAGGEPCLETLAPRFGPLANLLPWLKCFRHYHQ
jgi:hypothetical protein